MRGKNINDKSDGDEGEKWRTKGKDRNPRTEATQKPIPAIAATRSSARSRDLREKEKGVQKGREEQEGCASVLKTPKLYLAQK